jgi:hypothetical protein
MNADKILADSREQQERTEAILSRQEALLAKAEILLYRLEERLAGEPIFGSEKGTFKISGGVEKDPPGNHQ